MQNVNEGIGEYEKLTDTLIFFGEGVTLDFVVELAYKYQGQRRYYYSEYRYVSHRYDEDVGVVGIKRTPIYYLQLVQKNNPFFLRINRAMQSALQQIMEEADKWYSPKSKVFQYKEDKLTVVGEHLLRMPFPDGFGIGFAPVVLYNNKLFDKGCRLYLNDSNNFVDISVDKFKEFLNIIQKLEMYTAYLGVLNQVRLTRSEMKDHRFIDRSNDNDQAFSKNSKAQGRGNFFDQQNKRRN